MAIVLDSSAVIGINDFRNFKNLMTIPEVFEEIIDKYNKIKISNLKIKAQEPSKKFIKKVILAAKETGDINVLSSTDMKLLALALETKSIILTDDYDIQNMAEVMGIKYLPVNRAPIKDVYQRKRVCKGCGREMLGDVCSNCGLSFVGTLINKKGKSPKKN